MLDSAKLRAWRSHRQGLDGSFLGKSPAEVLEQTGWARAVGGCAPYLGLHARCGASREAIDGAVERLEIHELPSARGCTYVVPRSAFALALKLSANFGPVADMKTANKLGVTDAEVDKLCSAVLDALKKGPLDPEQLRSAAGDASRSLGEAGKKKGMTTTLPLALGRLQSEGEIRRVPTNGRLDQQRYKYTLWRPNPLAKVRTSPAEMNVELARLFFRWIGPATLSQFQNFAGITAKAAKEAIQPLELAEISSTDLLILREDLAAFEAFKPPKTAQFSLVGMIDGLVLLRRDIPSLLAPEDEKVMVQGEKGKVAIAALSDLPSNAILDSGRLVGLWEYDPEAGEIAWSSFIRPTPQLREQVRATQAFVHDQLGDARSFSLDSPKSRVPRIQALRQAQAALA